MLTELEKKIIASIQGDIPVISRPYLEISKKLKISEETLLKTLKDLFDKGVIRRFGATIRHQVDEKRIEEVGEKMSSFKEVSHCYRRNPTDKWPYNLYTMVHAKNEDTCRKIAQTMSSEACVENYKLLFSRREFKKTSMKYFSADVKN
ncbi:MAG: Lrp/AsnC family transcriptional regulator [Deltaproteobacteria bacterium]|nr:Lrp/AsnC family transcriptional regulator [Deltaproteobacteria bacterium]